MGLTGNTDGCSSFSPLDKCYTQYARCSCDSEQLRIVLLLVFFQFSTYNGKVSISLTNSALAPFIWTDEAYLRLRCGYGSDLSDTQLEGCGCFLESNIFLRGWGVGRNFLKGSVILSGQMRHWSHFNVQTRCNQLRVYFGVMVVKKIQFENNKPIRTKEKITSSERGLNVKTRKRH